jgi:hypothetical protein
MIRSGCFRAYWPPEVVEYHKDIFVVTHRTGGQVGATKICGRGGYLKYKKIKAGMSCERFKKYFPQYDERVGELPSGAPKAGDTIAFEVPVFTSSKGGIHLYNEKEKRFEPGYEQLPVWSWPTFAMLPFTLLVLYYGLRWTWQLWLKKKHTH